MPAGFLGRPVFFTAAAAESRLHPGGPVGGAVTGLDHIPDLGFQGDAVEAVDLLDAGGRGDVDLRHEAADHVDADEDQSAFFQRRADGFADLQVAAAEVRLLRLPADMHVGPGLALRRHAVCGAGRAAVNQDDALVAAAHLRQVALHDDRLAVEIGEEFQQGREVLVAGGDVKDPGAAVAEQRLHDDVPVLGAKSLHLRPAAGDQGRRHQLGKMGDEELLRSPVQPRRKMLAHSLI